MATPQIFNPATVTPEQTAGLVNIPGQSITETNTPATIAAAQNLNPSPNIPVYSVSPTNPVVIPSTTDNVDYGALVRRSYDDVKNTQTGIDTLTKSLGSQSADQVGFEQSLGVNEDKKALNDLNAQLQSLNTESLARQEAIKNQPILSSIASGQSAQEERTRAIKALSLSGQIVAMQGNLSLANDKVTQALALKYDPIKAQIEALTKQLDYNYKTFDKTEQALADKIKADNAIKLKKVEADQAREKAFLDTAHTALANNAPLRVVQQAEKLQQAGQEDAARALLANYTGPKGYNNSTNPGTSSEQAAVNLYSETIDKAIAAGASPAEAVTAAVTIADTTGTKLTLKEQNQLLQYAKNPTKKAAPAAVGPAAGASGTGSAEVSKVEASIAPLKKGGILSDSDIRYALKSQGYTTQEINASSVGNTLNRVTDSISSFLFGSKK